MVSKIFKTGIGALGEILSNQRTMSNDGFAPEAMVKDIKIVNNETNIDKLLDISSRDDVANMIINELNAEMPFDEVVEIADDFLRSDDIETKKVGQIMKSYFKDNNVYENMGAPIGAETKPVNILDVKTTMPLVDFKPKMNDSVIISENLVGGSERGKIIGTYDGGFRISLDKNPDDIVNVPTDGVMKITDDKEINMKIEDFTRQNNPSFFAGE